ncbi:MAG TPA: thioredoxin family protein [Candidatus Krumholzibacteria bacterium]|nr:thioredoxin family protein [Candidatus Krumholzibacteria bacterium]
MTRIQVLGPGCQKCKVLAERVTQAVHELGIQCEIEKVSDINQIIEFGIMSTPALAVDGAIKVSGHVPSVEKIKEMLS